MNLAFACCKSQDEANLFPELMSITGFAERAFMEGYFVRPRELRKPRCACRDDSDNFAIAYWQLCELVIEAVAVDDNSQ
jgi:hypothetical protein